MITCPRPRGRRPRLFTSYLTVSLILLGLLGLVGCQGLSANSPSDPPAQPGTLALGGGGKLDFGTVTVGKSKTLTATATNSGSSAVTITQASSNVQQFKLSKPALPVTVAAGSSVSVSVDFSPSGAGSVNGALSITSDASNSPGQLNLSGDGTMPGNLSVSPTSIAFGSILVGSNQKQSGILTNTGGSDLTVSQATVTGAGFSVSGVTFPLTLTAGQSANFSVTFAPQSPGTVNGNIAFANDGSNPTVNVAVSGTGLAQGSLSPNPGSLDFGNVVVGSNKTLPETLTNTSGTDVTITQATTSRADFSLSGVSLPYTLPAGQSKTFNVIFAPQSATTLSADLTIVSNASNPTLTIPLSGTGVQPGALSANPTSLNFGNVTVGKNKSLSETLTNTGGADVTISQQTLAGAGFSTNGLNLPLTLTPGQKVTFSVIFSPQSNGTINGSLTITSDASNPSLQIPLSGTGVAPGTLSANPTNLTFGNVEVGKNKSLSETLTNSGGSDVTISSETITGAGFSVTGLNLPLTLVPGDKVTFSVKFAPQSNGTVNGTLTINSDASNPSLQIPLSGTGISPGTLSANPTNLNFGNVTVGKNKSLSETLTNTGSSDVTISSDSVTGTGFSVTGLNLPITLAPGDKVTFSAKFAPQSPGTVNGTLTINSDASNPTLQIPLSGTGVTPGTLSANPTSLSFGNVQVGKNKSLPETLTNTGGSDVTISSDTVTGTGFSVSGLSLPLTLQPNHNVTFNVIFAPQSTGSVNGDLSIISDGSNPNLDIPLSGTGTPAGQLSVTPANMDFGDVVVGNNSSLPASLNATGADVTVTSGNSSNSAFTFSGLTFPFTVQAGKSKNFTVTFTPQGVGQANATLTFNSDASNSPTIETLTGNGKAPTQHSVLLTWNASDSQDVIGYNVYRGNSSGGPYSKIATQDPDTSYTDTSVSNGKTYYYVTRAVDSNNQESVNSNEAVAVIPSS